jgi:hypothetical protein
LKITKGNAFLIKKDIFKNLMWYTLPDSTKHYPVTIERVRKIKSLNMQGVFPEELEAVEVTSTKQKEVEPEFVDVVGQISLRSLEKADRKRKQQQQQKQKPQQRQQGPQQRQQGGQQRNQPPQQRGGQQKPNRPNPGNQRPPNPNQPPPSGGNR